MPAKIALISEIIGKKGVRYNRLQNILIEIVTEHGDVKTDKTSVLNKWTIYFEKVCGVANDEEIQCDYSPLEFR